MQPAGNYAVLAIALETLLIFCDLDPSLIDKLVDRCLFQLSFRYPTDIIHFSSLEIPLKSQTTFQIRTLPPQIISKFNEEYFYQLVFTFLRKVRPLEVTAIYKLFPESAKYFHDFNSIYYECSTL